MHSTERPNEPPSNRRMAEVFDSYCKKALRYAALELHRERRQLNEREVPFSGLSVKQQANLASTDEYFKDAYVFDVLGEKVNVSDGELAEALDALTDERRGIVLMSFFCDMTDGEIAERLNMARSTVAYNRTSSLRQLKKFLESEE